MQRGAQFGFDSARLGGELGGLDGVEQVVDDVDEPAAAGVDGFQVGSEALSREIGGFFQQHFAVTDDVIQRRAELMLQVIVHWATP